MKKNYISNDAASTRMFKAGWMEALSKVHFSVPLVIYIPVIGFFIYKSIVVGVEPLALAGYFLLGLFLWTIAEYILHRWVFHYIPSSKWGLRLHFIFHGVHHDYPSDKDRLVMPLLTSAPLAVIFYSLFTFLLGRATGEPFFAGFVVGYLFYDGTHYFVHHFVPTTRWGKFLRRHHMTHHHADHDGGFGVSSPLWDLVFHTMPSKKK